MKKTINYEEKGTHTQVTSAPLSDYHILTFSNGNHTIKLYEVIHIGTPEFYHAVLTKLEEDKHNGYALHMEGIIGGKEKNSLKSKYSVIAQHLDLVPQHEALNSMIEHDQKDMHINDLSIITRMKLKFISHLVDAQLKMLRTMEKNKKEQIRNAILYSNHKDQSTTLSQSLLGGEISKKRSYYAAEEAMKEQGNVSLVWGAAHSQEIVDYLTQQGYTVDTDEFIIPLAISP